MTTGENYSSLFEFPLSKQDDELVDKVCEMNANKHWEWLLQIVYQVIKF